MCNEYYEYILYNIISNEITLELVPLHKYKEVKLQRCTLVVFPYYSERSYTGGVWAWKYI